jgi:4-hydroxy-3-polyprenylbenzoate decarboxylase
VVLKEKRRLVLMVREAPLNEIQLENMLKLARMGVVITPPVPAFYNRPRSIDDLVDHTVSRVLDLFDIHLEGERWAGIMAPGEGLRPTPVRKTTLPRASRRSRGRNR